MVNLIKIFLKGVAKGFALTCMYSAAAYAMTLAVWHGKEIWLSKGGN